MNPDEIQLANLNKSFEYTKIAREIDSVTEVEALRLVAKCYAKLYLKTQETALSLGNM